jgi:hypothetical protein
MTPAELLVEVKYRFYSLLHDDPNALNALLKQALGAYQGRAGVTETMIIKTLDKDDDGNSGFAVPDAFLARLVVKSKTGDFVTSQHDRQTGRITINPRGVKLPIKMTYFVNLRGVDIDAYELQPDSIGLIQDYLEILISIPNCERNRRVAVAGNLDVSDIPSESDLFSRKTEIELRMTAARCALPMISIQP